MDDIHEGKINCIIVKDLSRLGRNYIEMGRLLQNILPSVGVRVIAINDHYDSQDEEDATSQIIVPFKNLINDAYCRDISMKIRSQCDTKRRHGKYIGSFALYGYKKDPKDHCKLIIDETAAEIVELIFNLKLDGYSSERIVRKLNDMNIPTPLDYKRMCGFNFNSGFRSKHGGEWNISTINRILRNEMYTGTMVQGKRRKINYKLKQIIDVDPSEWFRVEGTHEAIVPKEVFDTVQRILTIDTRTAPANEKVSVFSGVLRCGSCGQNMVKRRVTQNGKAYVYYHCTTHKNGRGCTSHQVSEVDITPVVLETIRMNLRFLADSAALLKSMKEHPYDVAGVNMLEKQIAKQNKELEKYVSLKSKLYEDVNDGVISCEEYADINENFTIKIDRVRSAIEANEKKCREKKSIDVSKIPWIEDFLQYANIRSLERRVVLTLIDKIVVHDKKHIEVIFRHKEEMQEIINIAMTTKEVTA